LLQQAGREPFSLQYDNPQAKKMRSGDTASTGSLLTKTPPPFDPRKLQAEFIKGSSNPLQQGFTSQDFDPIASGVQKLINKAGTNANFGSFGDTTNPKDESNVQAQTFLKKYQEGVQRQLIAEPVSQDNLSPFMAATAPYQKGDGLVNESKPFPGGDPSKIE
jgi:hypothetical protein